MSALAEALVAAQAELPTAIGKDSDGQIGTRSYKYLSLDKLIEATRPILNRHGLSIVQHPTFLTTESGAQMPALQTVIVFAGDVTDSYDEHEYLSSTMPLYVEPKTMQGL